MAMTRTSAWTIGTTGLCVALSAASWFLLIQPERAEAAETRQQTVAAEQANAQLEIRIDQLRQEYADLPARQAELAAIRQALPEEPALASLIRDINTAAADSGIVVDAVTTGTASAVIDPAALTAVEGDAAAEGGDPAVEGDASSEGADGAESTGESSAPPVDPESDGGSVPVDAGSGVSEVPGAPAGAVLAAIPLTIDTTGDFYQSNLLIKNLQTDIARAMLIDGLTIQVVDGSADGQESDPGTVTTTITARVFAFVDPDSVEAVDAPVPSTTD